MVTPWEQERRRSGGVRKTTPTRRVDTSTLAGITRASGPTPSSYRPPSPAAQERQRAGGTAGRSTMGAVGPATGSTKAYNDMGADMAFNRVNDWRMQKWFEGDPAMMQLYGNQPTQPAPTSPGGGSRRGGGGGGGGGMAGPDPAAFDAYAKQAMAAIAAIKAIENPLAGVYNGAVDKDISEARNAYAGIADNVSMTDPYLAMVAQSAPTVDPGMEKFLRSQGMGTGEYDSAVAQQNAELRAGADNWSNYGRAMGKNFQAGQQDVVNTAKLQGENIVQGFEGQRNELQAYVAAQQAAEAQRVQQERMAAIMQLLATGLQYGRTPDVGGLLK